MLRRLCEYGPWSWPIKQDYLIKEIKQELWYQGYKMSFQENQFDNIQITVRGVCVIWVGGVCVCLGCATGDLKSSIKTFFSLSYWLMPNAKFWPKFPRKSRKIRDSSPLDCKLWNWFYGKVPWSNGYGRRFMMKRPWLWIPTPETRL